MKTTFPCASEIHKCQIVKLKQYPEWLIHWITGLYQTKYWLVDCSIWPYIIKYYSTVLIIQSKWQTQCHYLLPLFICMFKKTVDRGLHPKICHKFAINFVPIKTIWVLGDAYLAVYVWTPEVREMADQWYGIFSNKCLHWQPEGRFFLLLIYLER